MTIKRVFRPSVVAVFSWTTSRCVLSGFSSCSVGVSPKFSLTIFDIGDWAETILVLQPAVINKENKQIQNNSLHIPVRVQVSSG
jgi:hypothetical protein